MCEAARAGNDRRNARVRKHELQGRRSQGDAEILANPFDGADAREDRFRRQTVIVVSAVDRACRRDAAIVAASERDRDIPRLTERQEGIERVLFEQRVAPGEQEAIEVPFAQGLVADLPFVTADADRFDQALRPQLVERLVGTVHGGAEMRLLNLRRMAEIVDVVDERNVDALERHALKAVFEGAHGPIVAVVVNDLERRRIDPELRFDTTAGLGFEEPADLRRENIFAARAPPQPLSEAKLGEAVPVERGRVEIPEPCVPCAVRHRASVDVGHKPELIAERRCSEAHRRHFEPRGAEGPLLRWFHRALSSRPVSGRHLMNEYFERSIVSDTARIMTAPLTMSWVKLLTSVTSIPFVRMAITSTPSSVRCGH